MCLYLRPSLMTLPGPAIDMSFLTETCHRYKIKASFPEGCGTMYNQWTDKGTTRNKFNKNHKKIQPVIIQPTRRWRSEKTNVAPLSPGWEEEPTRRWSSHTHTYVTTLSTAQMFTQTWKNHHGDECNLPSHKFLLHSTSKKVQSVCTLFLLLLRRHLICWCCFGPCFKSIV